MLFRSRISSGGNVGIGTASPSDKLYVAGNLRVSGEYRNGAGSCLLNCPSDARFKRNIRPLGPMLERLAALRPVQYEWRTEEFSERRFPTTTTSGLIAQEVERVLPELVTYDEQGYEGVAYHLLPVYNLQAIQELKAMNEALQALVIAQQTEVGELRKILTSLQRQMGTQVSKAVVSGQ